MIKGKKAEYEFKDYMIALIVGALFIVSLYGFITKIGENYNKDLTIDNSKIDFIGLKKNLTSLQSEAWQQAVMDDKVNPNLGILVLQSIGGVAKLMWNAGTFFIRIYAQISYNVFGLEPMVTGTVITILIILIIFAFWRVLKTG